MDKNPIRLPIVVEKYTGTKSSLPVPARNAPKAVMVSPGRGGKIFSINALKPSIRYKVPAESVNRYSRIGSMN